MSSLKLLNTIAQLGLKPGGQADLAGRMLRSVVGNILPRAAGGEPQALGANLGSDAARWAEAHCEDFHLAGQRIGTAEGRDISQPFFFFYDTPGTYSVSWPISLFRGAFVIARGADGNGHGTRIASKSTPSQIIFGIIEDIREGSVVTVNVGEVKLLTAEEFRDANLQLSETRSGETRVSTEGGGDVVARGGLGHRAGIITEFTGGGGGVNAQAYRRLYNRERDYPPNLVSLNSRQPSHGSVAIMSHQLV